MATEIRRLELTQDREGNPEVFVEVVFDSVTYGKLNMGHWLTASEMVTFNADNEAIVAIMEPYLITAELRKADELIPREPLE